MTPWTAARQAFLFITNSQNLLKRISIKSVMPSNHLILCCPLLLLPSIFPDSGSFPMSLGMSLFQWVSSSHQVAKVLEFQLQALEGHIYQVLPLSSESLVQVISKPVRQNVISPEQPVNLKGANTIWGILTCLSVFCNFDSHYFLTTHSILLYRILLFFQYFWL